MNQYSSSLRLPRVFSVACCAFIAAAALLPTQKTQAAFPEKPIRMIVISSAGGSTDMVARAVGRALGEGLGQAVVLDNRPGGGGVIAAALTAKARPDGYTILMANTAHTVQPSLHAKLPYDAIKDFAPVSLVALTHSVLLVHPSLPVKSVRELIDYAKANPGKLNYSSGTNGSSAHIGGELLKLMGGIDMVRVPYKGTAENLNALLANQFRHAAGGAAAAQCRTPARDRHRRSAPSHAFARGADGGGNPARLRHRHLAWRARPGRHTRCDHYAHEQ